jgi:putative FmdB family regulatory protein
MTSATLSVARAQERDAMPLYEYQCTQCGERKEVLQKFSDPPYSHCPKCNGAMKKLLSSPAIQFKGSGFYKTDYASKSSSSSSKGESSKGESSKGESSSGESSKGESSKGESSKGDPSKGESSKNESSASSSSTEARSETKSKSDTKSSD